MTNSDSDTRVIFPEDPEAAPKLVKVKLWRGRDGRLYPKDMEDLARMDRATHRHCEDCGTAVSRQSGLMYCNRCLHRRDIQRWNALPKRPWDGETPICVMNSDTYFFSEDDLTDYCYEHEVHPDDLLLMHCQPVKLRELDAGNFFWDAIPEDSDPSCLPQNLLDAIDKLNDVIRTCPPMAWRQGNEAVDLYGLSLSIISEMPSTAS